MNQWINVSLLNSSLGPLYSSLNIFNCRKPILFLIEIAYNLLVRLLKYLTFVFWCNRFQFFNGDTKSSGCFLDKFKSLTNLGFLEYVNVVYLKNQLFIRRITARAILSGDTGWKIFCLCLRSSWMFSFFERLFCRLVLSVTHF